MFEKTGQTQLLVRQWHLPRQRFSCEIAVGDSCSYF